jgi:hypothetical protein
MRHRLQRTTQLVWHVLESFGIAVSGLCIRPKRIVERSGGECPLFKVLARLDSKSVTLLNAALQGLFTTYALVLASRPLVGFCSVPPFFIDVGETIIECAAYSFADKAGIGGPEGLT